jgi:epoxyqueuosine reductase
MLTTAAVRIKAQELGFDLCGVAPAAALPELQYLSEWLAHGYAGEMSYLHKSAETRSDIRKFLPGTRSVIVTGTLYNTEAAVVTGPPLPVEPRSELDAGAIRVARYARGHDYHVVLADRLAALAEWMQAASPEPFEHAIFVDKHHVQERVYARHAGLGWIGKNSCLINPELGSYLFLAGLATSLPLEADAPGFDRCGSCTLCIDACPTGALVDAHELDATKCISYLTIEKRGPLPEEQRTQIGNHAYGCDICQDVCPWNLAPLVTADPAWSATPRDGASAAELWQRTDRDLHEFVKGSAMTHLPLAGLRRNLATVIGNSGDSRLAPVLERPGGGVKNAAPSAATPAVTDAVAWARERLQAVAAAAPPDEAV